MTSFIAPNCPMALCIESFFMGGPFVDGWVRASIVNRLDCPPIIRTDQS